MTACRDDAVRAKAIGDVIPMADGIRVGMAFREGAAHVNGTDFTLYPERGVHNAVDVRRAKGWLRDRRDVLSIMVVHVEPTFITGVPRHE